MKCPLLEFEKKITHIEEIVKGSHLKENVLADEKCFKEEAVGLISEEIYFTIPNYSPI